MKRKNSHLEWREALISELLSTYPQEAKARQRARRGMFLDLLRADVPFENHKRGQRGVRAACKVCSTLQNAAKKGLEKLYQIKPRKVMKTWSRRMCRKRGCPVRLSVASLVMWHCVNRHCVGTCFIIWCMHAKTRVSTCSISEP